jgi:hypothetical protein
MLIFSVGVLCFNIKYLEKYTIYAMFSIAYPVFQVIVKIFCICKSINSIILWLMSLSLYIALIYYFATEWWTGNVISEITSDDSQVIFILSYTLIYGIEVIIGTLYYVLILCEKIIYTYCVSCKNCGHKHFNKCTHRVNRLKKIITESLDSNIIAFKTTVIKVEKKVESGEFTSVTKYKYVELQHTKYNNGKATEYSTWNKEPYIEKIPIMNTIMVDETIEVPVYDEPIITFKTYTVPCDCNNILFPKKRNNNREISRNEEENSDLLNPID